MSRLAITLVAVLAVVLSAAEGDLGHAARVVVAVLAAVVASRALQARPHPVLRPAVVALWLWVGVDIGHLVGSQLEFVAMGLGYVAIAVAGVRAVRTLGEAAVRPVVADAVWAGVAVVAVLVDSSQLDEQWFALLVLGVGVFVSALWLQFTMVRRADAAAVRRLWIAIVAMLASLAIDVAVDVGDVDLVALTAMVGRLALAAGLAHPRVPSLFEPGGEEPDRIVGSRVTLAVALLVAAAAGSRFREITSPESTPVWQALFPMVVLATTARHTRLLYGSAVRDNDALRRSVRRDPTTEALNEHGLRTVLAEGGRGDGHVLLVVSLDGFRALLRRLDPEAATELVRSTARRLERAATITPVVARCDTDEFVLLSPGDPVRLAQSAQHTLGQALYLSAAAVSVQINVRIGWAPVHDDDPVAALTEARFAAQEAGPGGIVQFTAEERERYRVQRMLLREFPAALRQGQVVPHYQPIVDVATGSITSFEVLARWTHPTLGPVSPGTFIPLAESSGAIVRLGESLLRTACTQLASWRRMPGYGDLGVTVNLSPRQLSAVDLGSVVTTALADAGLPPDAVTLELTEGMLADLDHGAIVLRDLQTIGVKVAVDDFGTGYSSMAYLDELRPDTVKVDRRFTQALTAVHGDVARGVFDLLTGLGLPIVAEGVEDEETLRLLRTIGCDHWQGFLHSRPMSGDDATALLASVGEPTRAALPAAPVRHPVVEHAVGSTLGDHLRPAVVVDADCTWQDVERLFVASGHLSSVVVRRDDGELSTLSATEVHRRMTGPYGFGRSLHARDALRSHLGTATRAVPAETTVVDAVAAAMARPVERRYDDLLVTSGDTIGVVSVSVLLAELANNLGHLAARDELTGLPNRRHFIATVGGWVGDDEQVGMLVVDLDGFKPINDDHGHAAGDVVLTTIATRLRACARGGDVVARLGGNEFAVALRGATPDAVAALAARVVEALASPVEWEGRRLDVAASVGCALGGFEHADAVIAAADSSMAAAKQQPGSAIGPLLSAPLAGPRSTPPSSRRRRAEGSDGYNGEPGRHAPVPSSP